MHGITRKFLVAGAVALAGAIAAQTAHAAADVKVKVYGQVNRALLWADDGDESKLYFVDNKNSSTRFGIDAKAAVEGGMTAGGKFEAELQSNSSTDVNQLEEKTDAVLKERIMEVWLEGAFGKVSIGQGDTASNKSAEVDLSGTEVIAYSSVEDLAGGIFFYDEAAASSARSRSRTSSTTSTGSAATTACATTRRASAASRRRPPWVRRNSGTPRCATAAPSARRSWAAAVAYADYGDLDKTVDGQISGSASVLLPFGLSLTGAAGQKQLDRRLPAAATTRCSGTARSPTRRSSPSPARPPSASTTRRRTT